ncbi:concanavalin A-like lectin/glucanase [Rhizoclosmatium globosum]|uniref:Concanavalin A-like lectin/glucanase n=1 Tax=Rhizoclosmatium globosum TaxID=329046 RepID=A0A1Y2BTU4_9FUNG|nr:concanavalin A-like lectin/glucanase [Rhizoclosmatium globosum]|eukprot:ORY38188.1 concanavalin A-like lectin/glucanase [Rhizoclosmatium globosum]
MLLPLVTALFSLTVSAINLALWDIQLPDGSAGHLYSASLILSQGNPRFTNVSGNLVFITPPNGVPTSGSSYPRTELRQMAPGGSNAAWKVNDGLTHKLSVTLRVDSFPWVVQSRLSLLRCLGQGAELMLRVYQTGVVKLFNNFPSAVHSVQLESGYTVGQFISASIAPDATGTTVVSYTNLGSGVSKQITTTVDATQTYYFKTGSYCQCSATDSGVCQVP